MSLRFLPILLALPLALTAASPLKSGPDIALLPFVPDGLKVALFAREPLVRNPCAMAFDGRGRLFVGQGPQYRNPKPDTPGDTVEILIDTDGDGIADKTKTFARGLNCIQGLAWHGRDLWIANSPDLTIVRDLDGDDEADEYVRVYTDLGNLEHALHGLNWAPDGKLYMSKGTSKGLTQAGRIAPKPFRDLWGVEAPPGAPDFPPVKKFTKGDYVHTYQDPEDDWGKEGGVLRCDNLGANLEIVSRGLRNPWDIGFDSEFNWLGTDNDQYDGDRIFMPFFGAHFGWAHSWSADWTGENHLPTAPISGPVFPGSGTGIVYYDTPQLPPAYRGVWFINDWLRKTIFVYRPQFQGALLQPEGGKWQEFAVGRSALFQPVDIDTGPDGDLFVTGWGKSYGAVFKDGKQINEGRIFRISWPGAPTAKWNAPHRGKEPADWTFAELVADLGSYLPVWRTNAQEELVRRGSAVLADLKALLKREKLATAQETWVLWTIGRIDPNDRRIDDWFATTGKSLSANALIQSLRIVAHRIRDFQKSAILPPFAAEALNDPEPRVRCEAVQAVWQARQKQLVAPLYAVAAVEVDRVVFYSIWQAMRELVGPAELQKSLDDPRAGVRRAALLALLEDNRLERDTVTKLVNDHDAQLAGIAALWLAKRNGNSLVIVNPAPRDFSGELKVSFLAGIKPAAVRWTVDGSEPTPPGPNETPHESGNLTIKGTTTIKAALFVRDTGADGPGKYKKVGATTTGTWTKSTAPITEILVVLDPPKLALNSSDVLPLIEKILAESEQTAMANGRVDLLNDTHLKRGQQLFKIAGCIACHRVGREGATFGPDLTAMGDKSDAKYLVESMLQPNAVIAEGFALHAVTTRDGESFAGIFKEETDRTLTLVQPDGQPVGIEKARIVSRENTHRSIMPSFEGVMSAPQMADLAAWLLAQRSQALERTLSAEETIIR